ncbi:MAG TPA: vitamin K epoxide reductase family protein [Actinomycetota bacterium]|nr:vitamin K epoxide reductase family protein [Actinomycetota bacterium]
MSDTKTSKAFKVPADEPSVVLLRLVRKMRLPYSARLVSAAVAAHPQPQSLLALVQVAPSLGLRITAARVEPEGLGDLQLPAIAHFEGEPGGFGVIERVTAESVEVWDGANGRRRVARDDFLARWSGIVALPERDPSQQKTERGYRQQRFAEAFAGPPGTRPDLATPAVFGGLAALVVLLVLAALWQHPGGTRLEAVLVTLVTVAGLGVSATLSRATADMSTNVNVPGCPRGKLVNCESVLNSQWAKVRGVPMSDIGTGFFGAILLAIAASAAIPGFAPGRAVGIAYLLAAPAALALIGTQVAMRRFCTLCLAVHGLVLLGAAASLPYLDQRQPALEVVAALALLLLLGAVVTFVGIPFLSRHARTQDLIERQQRLATSPFTTLAYVLTEPPSPVRGETCGFRLPGPGAPHEVVLFAHPNCGQCAQTIQEMTALAEAGTISAYVTILPRFPYEGPERDACAAVVAAGVAFGPAALLHAYFYAKKSFGALMNGDPVELLATEMSVRRDALEERLPEARAMIERTEKLAEGRIEGTPAVFFDGRLYPYNTPVSHLTGLLARHPELLPPPGSGREPRGPREAAPA